MAKIEKDWVLFDTRKPLYFLKYSKVLLFKILFKISK